MSPEQYLNDAKYYATQLIQNNGQNNTAQFLPNIDNLFSQLKNAGSIAADNQAVVQQLKQAIRNACAVIPNNPDQANLDRLADEYQKNLAYFLKTKFNNEFLWSSYLQAATHQTTPDVFIKHIEQQSGDIFVDQAAKLVVDAQAMIDANGKPIKLIGGGQVEEIKNENGDITHYAITSSNPKSFIQDCKQLFKQGAREIPEVELTGLSANIVKQGASKKFIENILTNSVDQLLPLNLKATFGRGANAETYSLTSADMQGFLSSKARPLLEINEALKTPYLNNPNISAEQLIVQTFTALLTDRKAEAAQKLIEIQLNAHPNDATFIHKLMLEALNTGNQQLYIAICKALFPAPPKNANQNYSVEEARIHAYAHQQARLIDDVTGPNAEIQRMIETLTTSIGCLPDAQQVQFTNELNVQVNALTTLRDELQALNPIQANSAGNTYDIQAIETRIGNIKNALTTLETNLTNALQPMIPPQPINPPPGPGIEIHREEGIDPNTRYSPDVLIQSGVLLEGYQGEIARLTAVLEELNRDKEITPNSIAEERNKIKQKESEGELLEMSQLARLKLLENLLNNTPPEQNKDAPYPVDTLIQADLLPHNYRDHVARVTTQLNDLTAKSMLTPTTAQERLSRLLNEQVEGDVIVVRPERDEEIQALQRLRASNNQIENIPPRHGPGMG